MTIAHINPQKRYSDAVVYNDTIYYTAVPTNLYDNISEQTQNVLTDIQHQLQQLNSDKTRLLDVTIFLADAADYDAMNVVWDHWIAEQNPPVRCTVQATLMDPKMRIEIKTIAAI